MDDALEQEAVRALHRFFKGLKLMNLGEWSDLLAEFGMLDIGVIHHVGAHPEIMLGEVRKILGIPHSTLTSVVNRLEKKKALRRVISPRDRRSYGLVLTKYGRRIEKEHMRLDRLLADKVLKGLDGEEERRTFVELLAKSAQAMK